MYDFNAVGMSLDEIFRPKEVGKPVVSHVLENAQEPPPDFEAMRRAVMPDVERGEKQQGQVPKND